MVDGTSASRGLRFAVAIAACAAAANGADLPGPGVPWLQAFNPAIARLDRQSARVTKDLAMLPALVVSGAQYSRGYHSANLPCRDCPTYLVVDLGQPTPFDAIALFPAQPVAGGVAISGYGFPVRFRIEAATGPDFRDARILADETASDYPSPGLYPYHASFAPVLARWVRLTIARHWERSPGLYMVAVAELMVFQGHTNAALYKPVTVSVDSQVSLRWAPEFLVDGRTPVSVGAGRERSPSNGYHSLISSRQDVVKWVQVDLGSVQPIDEIVLVPAHPVDWLDAPGFGFPLRFRVEASQSADMSRPVLLGDYSRNDFDNPGDNPVTIPSTGVQARYVRLTATRLYSARARELLALAELQVISDGRNVALGKPVQSLDSFYFPPRPLWNPAFLTDGYSSDYNLLPIREWLPLMQGRQKLEREAAELTTLRAEAVETALARLTAGAAVLVLAAGGAAMLVAFRSRRLRQRQMRKVREQIARDLHDEVGSNLASISLISGASEPSEPAADLSRDLSEVHRIAVETNDALRDIVWLLHMDRTSAADLVDRMRSVAHRLLKSTAYSFDFTPELSSPALTLTMRKNALLAFKEALTNVIRHSAATEVKVHVAAGPSRFRFTVVDNGIGFCRDSQPPGDGIRNIECRAAELNGTMLIRTAPGHGATVEFEFPTRAQTRNRKAK